ncbi:MAG: hypothetical protein AAF604_11230 [Acidobacteriota bacterium]
MERRWVKVVLLSAAILIAGFAFGEEEVATATFSMYCYWTGEATLGRVDGVVASRIGHWGGAEIVQVDYDPQRTDVPELVAALRTQRSFDSVMLPAGTEVSGLSESTPRREVTGEPHFIPSKHSLRTRYPRLWQIGLSEAQAIALNSWSYFGGAMPAVLTAEQQRRLADGR